METPSWSVAAVVALAAGVSSRQRDRGRVSKAIFATRGEPRGPPPSDPEAGPRLPFPTDQLRVTVLYDEPRAVDRRPRAGGVRSPYGV